MSLPASNTAISESDTYTVVVSGQRFVLTLAQIQFDSPNHFTNAFLGGFSEASSRMMRLDSSPELFAFIVDYLRGYEILPLSPQTIPRTMDIKSATRNLLRDAEYLGLTRLTAKLSVSCRMPSSFPSDPWGFSTRLIVELDDVLEDHLPRGVRWAHGNVAGLISDEGSLVLVRAPKYSTITYVITMVLSEVHIGLTIQAVM
jgi:hypothetical protein